MINNGLIDFWKKNEFFKVKISRKNKQKIQNGNEDNENDDSIKPLNIIQLQSAYYFVVVGILVSSLTLFIETKVNSMNKKL